MSQEAISLPNPMSTGAISLEEAIAKRRSVRRFSARPLTWQQVGQLAWAAQGITGGDQRWRAAPSAGALHPLQLYILFPDRSFRYNPQDHSLQPHPQVDLHELATAALSQEFIAQAPCVFAFSAVSGRTTRVYKNRGRDYICMDLGHAAQNLLLQAAALGIAGTPVGAFGEKAVGKILSLPPDEEPLYLVPIGYPD